MKTITSEPVMLEDAELDHVTGGNVTFGNLAGNNLGTFIVGDDVEGDAFSRNDASSRGGGDDNDD